MQYIRKIGNFKAVDVFDEGEEIRIRELFDNGLNCGLVEE